MARKESQTAKENLAHYRAVFSSLGQASAIDKPWVFEQLHETNATELASSGKNHTNGSSDYRTAQALIEMLAGRFGLKVEPIQRFEPPTCNGMCKHSICPHIGHEPPEDLAERDCQKRFSHPNLREITMKSGKTYLVKASSNGTNKA